MRGRTIGITLGIPVAIVVLAWLFAPTFTLLFGGMVYQEIFGNHYPPPFAREAVAGGDWRHWQPQSARFTAVLRKRFLFGSDGEAMRAALLAEGFTNAKPPPPDCHPANANAPVGALICPTEDWQHRLDYDWGNLPCPEGLTVTWQTDRAGRIVKLDGSYGASCL